MALIARGGQLLLGYDGKLTTNYGCCCDPCDNVNCEGQLFSNPCFCKDFLTGLQKFKSSVIFHLTGSVPGGMTKDSFGLTPQPLPAVDLSGSYEFPRTLVTGGCVQPNKTYFLHDPVPVGRNFFGTFYYAVLYMRQINSFRFPPNPSAIYLEIISSLITNGFASELPVPTEDAFSPSVGDVMELLSFEAVEVYPCGESLNCLCPTAFAINVELFRTPAGHGLHEGITGDAEYTYPV